MGLFDYVGRSDWPMGWTALRARSVPRPNLGQWLRWEAALEEIAAYYRVPDGFRAFALRELGQRVESSADPIGGAAPGDGGTARRR